MLRLVETLVILFATSNGLVCLYTLISSLVIYTGKKELAKGEEFRKLIDFLFVMSFIGFLYASWNLLLQLGVVVMEEEKEMLIGNILLASFFVVLTYSAFLIKYTAKKYGFRKIGEEIASDIKKSAKQSGYKPSDKEKHSKA